MCDMQLRHTLPHALVLADWRAVPFYVVGHATAAAASQIRIACPSVEHLAPADVRGGAGAGTAERLAAFILAEGHGGQGRRMLYLTGDKNRETLREMLTAGGVALETLGVYRTTESPAFQADLEATLERAPVGKYACVRGGVCLIRLDRPDAGVGMGGAFRAVCSCVCRAGVARGVRCRRGRDTYSQSRRDWAYDGVMSG